MRSLFKNLFILACILAAACTLKAPTGLSTPVLTTASTKAIPSRSAPTETMTGQPLTRSRNLKHGSGITALAWSPDGQLLATGACLAGEPAEGCHGAEVQFWNADNLRPLHTIGGFPHRITSLAWSPKSDRLAIGYCQNITTVEASGLTCDPAAIRLQAVNSEEAEFMLEAGKGWASPLAYSPDGTLLASTRCLEFSGTFCEESEIVLIDTRTGNIAGHPYRFPSAIFDLEFSPGSDQLAIPAQTEIWIWDLKTGEKEPDLEGHPNWVVNLDWLPSGIILAEACKQAAGGRCTASEVWSWAPEQRQVVKVIPVSAPSIRSLEWSQNGRLFAVANCTQPGIQGCRQGEISVWDMESGKKLGSSSGLASELAFSPDGQRLAALLDTREVLIFRLSNLSQNQ